MESSIKIDNSVGWNIRDIASVATIIILVTFIITGGILYLFGDTGFSSITARYVIGLTFAVTPLLWLKIKYKLTKQSVGLASSKINTLGYLLIALMAITYHLILSLILHPIDRAFVDKFCQSFFKLIFLPLSIYSFATIVISPIGEEIFWRGFIYKYLRYKIGPVLGLILQACMFSLLHLNISNNGNIIAVVNAVIIGLVAGILYEKTCSIYPAIVFHCSSNYISIIMIALQR